MSRDKNKLREWTVKNREKINAQKRSRRQADLEHFRAIGREESRKAKIKHPELAAIPTIPIEKQSIFKRIFIALVASILSARAKRRFEMVKKWGQNNLDKRRKSGRESMRRHKDRNAARQRTKWATDPSFRLISNLRRRITMAVSRNYKMFSLKFLTGCSREQLMTYLERKFEVGMNWSNYGLGDGKWVIDHKLPVASFDHTDPTQQIKCWHFSNLQPMWWRDNLMKRDKILYPMPV